MKKILILFLVFTFCCNGLFSQSTGSSDYKVPFYLMKEKKELYFKNLVQAKGPSVLQAEGSEYREYQRWLDFWQARIAPDGTYESYLNSIFDYYKQHNTQPADFNHNNQNKVQAANSVLGNSDPWKELGPFKKPNAGLTSVGGGALGVGIIKELRVNRQNTSRVIAWSMAGGLYASDDKGLNWHNAGSDTWPRSGCSSADFSPVDANTWYGCSNIGGLFENNSIGYGGGVYRTNNAGTTWSLIGDASKFTYDVYGETVINKILIHPNDQTIAFLATRNGLYRGNNVNSTNISSITWTPIHTGFIDDMVFRTNGSGTLIISTKNSSNVWTIETSTNAGASWSTLPALPPPSGTTDYLNLEVSDAAPNSIYLRQGISGPCNVYVYNFTTSAWQYKSQQSSQIGGPAFGVSNFNASTIYIGQGIGFAKSTDGGATFTYHDISPNSTNQIHADAEGFVSTPSTCGTCSGEVYFCTHGGVSFTSDNATTIYTRCDGLGIAKPLGASSSATNPEKMMMGLDHDGTVLSSGVYSPAFTPAWETVYGGDGQAPLIDYSNANYAWAAAQSSVHVVSSSGGTAGTYSGTIFNVSNDWSSYIYQNQVYPDIVYCREATNVTGKYFEDLFRSNNRGMSGGTKEKLSNFANINIPAKGWPDAYNHDFWVFSVYPTKDANITYADLSTNGSVDGNGQKQWFSKLFKNSVMLSAATTVQNNWKEVPLPINPATGTVYKYHENLAVDASNPNIVYMAYNAHPNSKKAELYKADCTNPLAPVYINIAGDPANGGLPYVPINSIVTEKGSNGGIYVGTDVGVFYSNNSMLDFTTANTSQWILFGTNLPHVPIRNLEINYVANKLRVSTLGRGMWELHLVCPGQNSLTFSNIGIAPAFFEANTITADNAVTSPSSVTVFRATNSITLNPGFFADVNSVSGQFYAFIHPCDASGNSPFLKSADGTGDEEEQTLKEESPLVNKDVHSLVVYPNPTSGIFTLITGNYLKQDEEEEGYEEKIKQESETYNVYVYNAIGREVYTRQNIPSSTTELSINLESQAKGMYYVRVVKSTGQTKTTKLIVN